MQFKNVKTGNILTVTNETVIEIYKSQPEIYRPYKPQKAVFNKTDRQPTRRKSAKR